MPVAQRVGDQLVVHEFAETSTHARTIADDIKDQSGNIVVTHFEFELI